MRFHCLSLAHTISNGKFNCCAFTKRVETVTEELTRRGHETRHYGVEGATLNCTEHVTVVSKDVFKDVYGEIDPSEVDEDRIKSKPFPDHAWEQFHINAAYEIRKSAKPDDFVLCFYGLPHEPVARRLQDLPIHIVEPGVGYPSSFCKYRVFESYSKMNFDRGVWNERWDQYWNLSEEERKTAFFNPNFMRSYTDPEWTDVVIPMGFKLKEFEPRYEKDNYFMYLGRIVENKGLEHAVKVTAQLGKQLVIAGQGDFKKAMGYDPPHHVKILGPLNVKDRNRWLAGAIAVFCISYYIEPLCWVPIEAQLCGTPPIVSDFGGMVETVLPGITGYRVRLGSYEQAIYAAKNIDRIDNRMCRMWAEKNFSIERKGEQYEEYFDSLLRHIHNVEPIDPEEESTEWYTHPDRKNLDYLRVYYPGYDYGVTNGNTDTSASESGFDDAEPAADTDG